MAMHPYASLPSAAYWRSAVAEVGAVPGADYCEPKFTILPTDRIATAGSCFAQHIGRQLKASGYNVLDVEPAPALLLEKRRMDYGYGIYSARYGNVYTARQLLQLVQEAFGERPISDEVWEMDGRFVDALRPTIEPKGHDTREAVLSHRRYHLKKVRELLAAADLLVFTLGLTETWEDVENGRVYPVCPGTVAGTFDSSRHRFRNLTFKETYDDLLAVRALLHAQNRPSPTRILLTVSPVPLTATASGRHVLQATVYSKSVLRAVAGQLVDEFDDVDYFPSYEIVSNPWTPARRYAANLRTVTDDSVQLVMQTFMKAHSAGGGEKEAHAAEMPGVRSTDVYEESDAEMAVKCDEELLDAFGPRR